MIVVGILTPAAASPSTELVIEVARRAAATGATTEVLGVVPGDASWDRVTFELSRAGVGHATVVRSTLGTMEPADLELALRYLPDVRAIVLVRPAERLLPPAVAAADWAGATLIVVGPGNGTDLTSDLSPLGMPRSPIVIEPPPQDPEGTFAGFVAALATRLDSGEEAGDAWRATIEALAVDPVR